jgi:hypothetical protein
MNVALAVSDVTIDGFDSHRTSTKDAFLGLPAERIQQFEANILNPMVAAQMDPAGARRVAVVIIAHSDRQDSPGMADDARRADEDRISVERANDAEQFLFDQFADELQRAGGEVPVAGDRFDNSLAVSVVRVAAGAGRLLHVQPGNDETLRRQNRRVVFVAMTFPKS